MRDKDEFITSEEASVYLKVNIRTIYRWTHAGEIPAMRAGKQWRFRKSELDKWLRKRAKPSR